MPKYAIKAAGGRFYANQSIYESPQVVEVGQR